MTYKHRGTIPMDKWKTPAKDCVKVTQREIELETHIQRCENLLRQMQDHLNTEVHDYAKVNLMRDMIKVTLEHSPL